MNKILVKSILENIGQKYIIVNEDKAVEITNVKPIDSGDLNSLVWISKDKINKEQQINKTLAKTIICDLSMIEDAHLYPNKCLIFVSDPRLCFLRVIKKIFSSRPTFGIHTSAIIHQDAKIDNEVFIGPFSYVGKCEIGKNTLIYGNCHLYDNVKIGSNVTIHAGTVIGADGFGYQRNELFELEKFPHIGGVIIEDDVEIGANTCIDRGTLGNTLIGRGTKIDNLVHIAHNVIIGKHSTVIAHAMIGGSTIIGDYSWISPCVALRDRINIGTKVTAGLGAVVTKDIPDGQTWAGTPARELSEFLALQKKIKG